MKQAYEYGFNPENHDAITKEEYKVMARYQRQKLRLRIIRGYG